MAGVERKKVEADLPALNQTPTEYTDGSMAIHVPFDCPAYVRVHRLMKPTREHDPKRKIFSSGLEGHTITIDCFTFGVKVYVRLGRDGSLKVISEDAEGRETLSTWMI